MRLGVCGCPHIMTRLWRNTMKAKLLKTNPKEQLQIIKNWKEKEEKQKSERPVEYFFTVTVKDYFMNLYENLYRVLWSYPVHYIKYRTTHKYNILETGLKPNYYDFDKRILYGLFNELVNFVECEKAWMNIVFTPGKNARGLFAKYRSPEHGVAYLEWEMEVEGQATEAKEILELYTWWKEVYLKRPDPMDASGWSAYCDLNREKGLDILEHRNNRSEDEKQKEEMLIKNLHEIEEAYAREEEEMLLRLIKIRKSLWT